MGPVCRHFIALTGWGQQGRQGEVALKRGATAIKLSFQHTCPDLRNSWRPAEIRKHPWVNVRLKINFRLAATRSGANCALAARRAAKSKSVPPGARNWLWHLAWRLLGEANN